MRQQFSKESAKQAFGDAIDNPNDSPARVTVQCERQNVSCAHQLSQVDCLYCSDQGRDAPPDNLAAPRIHRLDGTAE